MTSVELALRRAPTGHLLTDVALDRAEPRAFLVDSAATATLVDPRAVPATAVGQIETGQGRVRGAGGATPETRRFFHGTLHLGDWETETELTILDLSHLEATLGASVAGILGLDVLGRGDLWLDLAASRLTLSPGPEATASAREAPASFLCQPFEVSPAGLILIDVEVDAGSPLRAILDFGAAVSVLNSASCAQLSTSGTAASGGKAKALGADNRAVSALSQHLSAVRLGGVALPSLLACVADLPIFASLGLMGPAMLLGLDALAGRSLGISFREKRLFLSFDAMTPAPGA